MNEQLFKLASMVEIENAMAVHAYCHAAGWHREEIDSVYVKDIDKTRFAFGGLNMRVSYVEQQEYNTKNNFNGMVQKHPEIIGHDYRNLFEISIHTLTTPLVQFSKNMSAATACWLTPGVIMQSVEKEDNPPCWIWERYVLDWVLEDGEWRYINIYNMMELRWFLDVENWVDERFWTEMDVPREMPKKTPYEEDMARRAGRATSRPYALRLEGYRKKQPIQIVPPLPLVEFRDYDDLQELRPGGPVSFP